MKPRLRIMPGSQTPIWRQIVDQIRAAIANGELSPGEAIPSVRTVAATLVINANTVAKAYAELTGHGDVISEHGRGLFVASTPPELPGAERKKMLLIAVERVVAEAVHLGVSRETLHDAIDRYCDKHELLPTKESANDT